MENNSYLSSALGSDILVNDGFFASSERDIDFLGGPMTLSPGESVTLSYYDYADYDPGTIYELTVGSLTYYFMVDDEAAARMRQAQS